MFQAWNLKRQIKKIESSYARNSKELEQGKAPREKFEDLEFSMQSALEEIEKKIDWLESNRLSRKAMSLDIAVPPRSHSEMWQRDEFGPKIWLSRSGRAHVRKLIHEERTRRFEAKSRWIPLLSVILAIISALISLVALTLQRKSADAATVAAGNTRIALELNRKMFNASQVAGFVCRIDQNTSQSGKNGAQMVVQVGCINRGKSGASHVAGDMTLVRMDGAKVVQRERRLINENIVAEGGPIDRFFFITRSFSWEWILRQDITASISLNYGNGIDNVTQTWCWRLLKRPNERSFSFADCVNLADAEKTTH